MAFTCLLKGIIIGFSLAAPVGPMGILCVRRTLAHGGWRGFVIGLSSASADVVYAVIAAFGVTLISNFVAGHQQWLRLVGGILLLALGFHTFRSHPNAHVPTKWMNREARVFISTFLLALSNPLTLFAYAAALSGIGVENIKSDRIYLTLLVTGVFLGSLLWSSLLTILARIFKEKVSTRGLGIVNKVAGSLLMLFGAIGLWTGLSGL
jgi:threonine/homoserine/homoserine lactone efflux protein